MDVTRQERSSGQVDVVTVKSGSSEDAPGVGSRGLRAGPARLLLGVCREGGRPTALGGAEGGPERVLQSPGEGRASQKLAGWPQPGSDPRRKEVSMALPLEVGGPCIGSQAVGCEGEDLW